MSLDNPSVEATPVGVVVVTWNSRAFVSACLESVLASDVPVKVVVVDNASTDGTAEFLRACYPSVMLVASSTNDGFAAAVNRGVDELARETSCAIAFLLNPDATVEPDTIGRLALRLENEDLGIVCPTILYQDRDVVWFDGSELDLRRGEAPHRGQGAVWAGKHGLERTGRACGCAMVVRIADYQRTGGMLEDLFLYWEDTDLSLRFADAGLETAVDRAAIARHAASTSSGGGGSFVYEYYMTRNRMRIMHERSGRSAAKVVMIRLPRSLRYIARMLISGDAVGAATALRAQLWAYRDFVRGVTGARHLELL